MSDQPTVHGGGVASRRVCVKPAKQDCCFSFRKQEEEMGKNKASCSEIAEAKLSKINNNIIILLQNIRFFSRKIIYIFSLKATMP